MVDRYAAKKQTVTMDKALKIPPRPAYRGEAPSQARLLSQHESIQDHHDRELAHVDSMFRTQRELGTTIRSDLAGLKKHNETLNSLETAEQEDAGVLAGLVRRFTRRRVVLNRRSETQALLRKHEVVSVNLRRASAFTDELRVTALEMQQEVGELHDEIDSANHNIRLCAERILGLETLIGQAIDSQEGNERLVDTLRFELRQEAQNLELFQATLRMCRQHLGPAKKLRDTVLKLQEEMSEFLVHATGTVDAAGRRIQALGAAADAPLVIQELQESMADLSSAMEVTEHYVEQTHHLITRVLPELSAHVRAEAETQHFMVEQRLGTIDRDQAKRMAELALRAEAENEIEQLLRGD